jgi:hypothetical protein
MKNNVYTRQEKKQIVKTCSYKDGYLPESKVASQFEDFNALSGLNVYSKFSNRWPQASLHL